MLRPDISTSGSKWPRVGRWITPWWLLLAAGVGCASPPVRAPVTAPEPVLITPTETEPASETHAQEILEKLAADASLLYFDEGRILICNRFIEVINSEQAAISEANASSPAELRQLSEILNEVAQRVAAVDLTLQPPLDVFRQSYLEMLNDLATTSRMTAEAMEAKDLAKLQEAQKSLAEFGPRETEIVSHINDYCQDEPAMADALPALRERCDEGVAYACLRIAQTMQADDAAKPGAAADFAAKACERGVPDGCMLRAEMHDSGEGAPRDKLQALSWHAKACHGNIAQGCMKAADYFARNPAKVDGADGALMLYARACATVRGTGVGIALNQLVGANPCLSLESAVKEGVKLDHPLILKPLRDGCARGVKRACRYDTAAQ